MSTATDSGTAAVVGYFDCVRPRVELPIQRLTALVDET